MRSRRRPRTGEDIKQGLFDTAARGGRRRPPPHFRATASPSACASCVASSTSVAMPPRCGGDASSESRRPTAFARSRLRGSATRSFSRASPTRGSGKVRARVRRTRNASLSARLLPMGHSARSPACTPPWPGSTTIVRPPEAAWASALVRDRNAEPHALRAILAASELRAVECEHAG